MYEDNMKPFSKYTYYRHLYVAVVRLSKVFFFLGLTVKYFELFNLMLPFAVFTIILNNITQHFTLNIVSVLNVKL